MSFILDALKKSESERQRQGAPGIASIPESGTQKGGVKWFWISAALLAVNLVVLAALFSRPGESVPATAGQPVPPAVVQRPVADAAPEPVPDASPAVKQVASRQRTEDASPTATTPSTPSTTEKRERQPAPRITATLPSFAELRARGVLQLPDMHLDIHVYSGEPAARFVFINMAKYREKATLSEGPTLVEITPDGAMLNYQGSTFLLPRE